MLVVVADAANFSSMRLTPAEKASMAHTWTRILMPIIPEDRLLDCLDRAVADHQSNFAVNGYDLKLAWEKIFAEESEAEEKRISEESIRERLENPVKFCAEKSQHANADGEVLFVNPFDTTEEILAPCRICRPKAHDIWRGRHVERSGGRDLPPVDANRGKDLLESLSAIAENAASNEMQKPAAVELSGEEIVRLRDEHNRLVRLIVEDDAARRNLEIVYDEGAEIFKLPHRADVVYSAEVVGRKIESYKKILEGK